MECTSFSSVTPSPLPSREAIDTALYLLDGSGPARSSGIAQLVTLLKEPSFRENPVLEEHLSSLLQVLIGQVERMEEGAIAWQASPIDSETVNALGCLLTGPSLRESSLAAGAMPAQAKAAERRLQQSLARKALHALCQLCASAPARSELQECGVIVISTVLRKATLPASAVVPEAEHCVRALAKSLADRPYATDPVAAEAAVMGLRALISVDRDQLQRCVALWVGPVCSCALRVIEPQTKRGGGDGGQGAGQDGSGRGQGSGAAAVAAGGSAALRRAAIELLESAVPLHTPPSAGVAWCAPAATISAAICEELWSEIARPPGGRPPGSEPLLLQRSRGVDSVDVVRVWGVCPRHRPWPSPSPSPSSPTDIPIRLPPRSWARTWGKCSTASGSISCCSSPRAASPRAASRRQPTWPPPPPQAPPPPPPPRLPPPRRATSPITRYAPPPSARGNGSRARGLVCSRTRPTRARPSGGWGCCCCRCASCGRRRRTATCACRSASTSASASASASSSASTSA